MICEIWTRSMQVWAQPSVALDLMEYNEPQN